MPHLAKRGSIWWYSFTVDGSRIRRSSKTSDKRLDTIRENLPHLLGLKMPAWLIEAFAYITGPFGLGFALGAFIFGFWDVAARLLRPRIPALEAETIPATATIADGSAIVGWGGVIRAEPERPRRDFPKAAADAISQCAIEASDRLQELGPPLVKKAHAIIARWERHELTYQVRDEFTRLLGDLSEGIHALGNALRELQQSNHRFTDSGFLFVFNGSEFNGSEIRGNFQQAAAHYANAILQMIDGQPAEVLRLHNENLGNTAAKFDMCIKDMVRKLMYISQDPSQFY